MLIGLVWCIFAIAQIASICADDDCIVHFPEQSLGVGVASVTFNKFSYCQYLGVRYATAERFRGPVLSVPKYNEYFSKMGSVCPQMNDLNRASDVLGDEDCLFLNVFAPEARGKKLLPVLVFIHGGSFSVGSSSFDIAGVDLLMENRIIVVSINYRLDVLGFLHYPKFNVTGNNGLKDQLVALRWINRYIESFGGDPNQVTLMGQSAGAASVNYHLYSAHSEGLFQQAALLSGTFLAPWAYNYRPEYCAEKLFKKLGITSREDLLTKNYKDFSLLQESNFDFMFFNMVNQWFVPTSETDDDPEAFLTATPMELIKRRPTFEIPLLVGITVNEMELFQYSRKKFYSDRENVPNRWKSSVWNLIDSYTESEVKRFEDSGIVKSQVEFIRNVSNHINMNFPIQYFANQRKEQSAPIYAYRFSFDGKFGQYRNVHYKKDFRINGPGAVHGDDLSYIFTPYNFKTAQNNSKNFQKEIEVHRKFTRMISNFVKRGNPSLKHFPWKAFNKEPNQPSYALIDVVPQMKTGNLLEPHYYNFCKAIYDCLYYFNCSAMQNSTTSSLAPVKLFANKNMKK